MRGKIKNRVLIFLLIFVFTSQAFVPMAEMSGAKGVCVSNAKSTVKYSKKQARKRLIKWLKKKKKWSKGLYCDYEGRTGNKYLFHVYSITINSDEAHTCTLGWYCVNTSSGKIKSWV